MIQPIAISISVMHRYHAFVEHGMWDKPNVFADTALAPPHDIKDYIDNVGYYRILFGSDFPFGDPKEELSKIMELSIAEDKKNDSGVEFETFGSKQQRSRSRLVKDRILYHVKSINHDICLLGKRFISVCDIRLFGFIKR